MEVRALLTGIKLQVQVHCRSDEKSPACTGRLGMLMIND